MTTRRGEMLVAIALAGGLDAAANWLAAHYLVPLGPWFLVPGGTFVFPLAFTIYDFLRRFHGVRPTLAAIALGFVVSVAYGAVWGGGIGRIALAGLVALAFSSSTDLVMQTWTLRWPIWRYVATSNTVSLLVDTVVFTAIAFAALPPGVRVQIVAGQYLVKLAMMLVSIPLVCMARGWATPRHGAAAIEGAA